jgi:hypothetical protein
MTEKGLPLAVSSPCSSMKKDHVSVNQESKHFPKKHAPQPHRRPKEKIYPFVILCCIATPNYSVGWKCKYSSCQPSVVERDLEMTSESASQYYLTNI